jgi:hypothetical protein
MYNNSVEMTILIKGRPITEYQHRGQFYVEGRMGSEYTIRVKNKTGGRVEAVVSVDGKSITDGKTAGPQSSGHLLNAYEEIEIPCWIVNSGTGAKFAFSGKEKSYSTAMNDGDAVNNGVIGIMAFAEKYQRQVYSPVSPVSLSGGSGYHHRSYGTGTAYNIGAGLPGIMSNSVAPQSAGWNSTMAASASIPTQRNTKSIRSNAVYASGANDYEDQSFSNDVDIQSLGTKFGEAMNYATVKVDFQRGDMIGMMILYYDDARGLKARGVVMPRPSQAKYQTKPEAFPNMDQGCVPPAGWRDNR